MLTTTIDSADRLINGQKGAVLKIEVDGNTTKTNIVYSEAGKDAVAKHANNLLIDNQALANVPVLTKIKIKPGKLSSTEIQRTQFPLI